MTKDQATNFVAKINKLFAPITQEKGTELIRDFLPFDADVVEQALQSHRKDPARTDNYFVDAKMLRLCRELSAGKKLTSTTTARQLTPAEIYRKQNPKLANLTDYVTICAVYRSHWFRVSTKESESEVGRTRAIVIGDRIGGEGYANQFRHECAYALSAAGMELANARSWAETIFTDPQHFRRCMEELRSMPSERESMTTETAGAMF